VLDKLVSDSLKADRTADAVFTVGLIQDVRLFGGRPRDVDFQNRDFDPSDSRLRQLSIMLVFR
jgi:hypothetical protein